MRNFFYKFESMLTVTDYDIRITVKNIYNDGRDVYNFIHGYASLSAEPKLYTVSSDSPIRLKYTCQDIGFYHIIYFTI